MKPQNSLLKNGLYLVSTPIGNSEDISLRALNILKSADCLAAEDTRITRKLFTIHGIDMNGRQLMSYHEHNANRQRSKILNLLMDGLSVALISDAGTPLISDPGFSLVRRVIEKNIDIISVPGPTALVAALIISGLATDRFLFAGFLPVTRSARCRELKELSTINATLIYYESAKRIAQTLEDMSQILGEDRQASLCREITKLHEEAIRGTLGTLKEYCCVNRIRGECVLVVGRSTADEVKAEDFKDSLEFAMKHLSMRDAVSEVASVFDLSRHYVYKQALLIRQNQGNS